METAADRILSAIERLDAKVDGVLQQQAATAEWRRAVDEDRRDHAEALEDLRESLTEQRIGHAKIVAYATGAAGMASAIGWLIGRLTGH